MKYIVDVYQLFRDRYDERFNTDERQLVVKDLQPDRSQEYFIQFFAGNNKTHTILIHPNVDGNDIVELINYNVFNDKTEDEKTYFKWQHIPDDIDYSLLVQWIGKEFMYCTDITEEKFKEVWNKKFSGLCPPLE